MPVDLKGNIIKEDGTLTGGQVNVNTGEVISEPTTITADSLTNQSEIKVPPTPSERDFGGAIDTSTKFLENYIKSLSEPSKLEQDSGSISQMILDKMGEVGEESTRREELRQEAGLPEQEKELRSVVNQLKGLTLESQAIPLQVQEEFAGRGATKGGVAPIETGRLRQNTIKSLQLAARGNLLLGDIESAQANIEGALEAEFGPKKLELETLEKLYTFNKDALERYDKKKADALAITLDERKRLLDKEENEKKEIYSLMQEALGAGADQKTLTAIANSQTKEQALLEAQKAGVSLEELKTQLTKLGNGQTVLVNTRTGEVIKNIGGAEVTGGNRDDLSAFQILEARNLAVEIFGKRAGAKPENYGLVEELMSRGMSADSIQDQLRYSGVSSQFEGDFKSAFEFVTKKGFSLADRTAAKDGLDELLEDGDIASATEYVLGLARDKADTETKRQVEGRDDALNALDRIESSLKALEDSGVNTGFLAGLSEKALEKGGFAVGTPEQNEIANEIAIAIIDYRKAVSGAAFTESEAKAYEKVFPSTGKTTKLNQTKINSLRTNFNSRQDSFYRRELGSSYDKLINSEIASGDTTTGLEDTLNNLSAEQRQELIDLGLIKE